MATIEGDISRLLDDCIAHSLSLTSPLDSCRAATVSTTFRRAADSDTVWDRFLPPDYREILLQALQPPTFSSKKELFFRLCDPILINGGKMSFELERSSGKKCFMISASEVVIVWEGTPEYWSWGGAPESCNWIPLSDSRFSEVAVLRAGCRLEIRGKIDTRLLSPKTTYCAYLVYKIAEWSDSLDSPSEASVTVGTYVSGRRVCLGLGEHSNAYPRHPELVIGRSYSRARRCSVPLARGYNLMRETRSQMGQSRSHMQGRMGRMKLEKGEFFRMGWMKLEMGEFFIDEGDEGEVGISLVEVGQGHWRRGLIVEGIEVRPMM